MFELNNCNELSVDWQQKHDKLKKRRVMKLIDSGWIKSLKPLKNSFERQKTKQKGQKTEK